MSENRINPNNIQAFDDKEITGFKQSLSQLELDQGKILETPPPVYEILGRFYKDENILIKQIEFLGGRDFKIGFTFPEYRLGKTGLEHVSGVQMTLARFQALYTAIILSIKQGIINSDISYEICLKNMCNVLYRGGTITHRKVLFPGEMGFLTVRISDIIKKGAFYTIECEFLKKSDAFLFGKEKCILENRFIEG